MDDQKEKGGTVREEELLFQAIGRFAVSFELMCDEMRECISDALQEGGLQNKDLAKIVVTDLTADPLRKLVGVIFVASWPKDTEGQRRVVKLLKSIQDLIVNRNRILHGTWDIGNPYWTDDMSVAEGFKYRTSEKRGLFLDFMNFTVDDFDAFSDEATRLKNNVQILRFDAFRGGKKQSDKVLWSGEFKP